MIPKSSQSEKNQTTGRLGEKLALEFLLKKNYYHIISNFHVVGGEIDLIMKKDGILIFVEVKTRTNTKFGSGEDAITQNKKRKLILTIYKYIQKKFKFPPPWQLDVIEIHLQLAKKQGTIKHFKNILLV